MQPGPGPGASRPVHKPHQARQGGRGGIAPAAACRPAASPAPTGQERSPRPPSDCRRQFSGDSARPSAADLSRLAFAAQLSNIHLWGFSSAAPFHEQGGKKIPSGGRSSLSEKRAGKGREKSARRPLDWHAVLCESPPRVPNGPRGKGRSGTPLTSENPRHGRSRLRGAPDGARTSVCGRVTESCRPRRGPGAQAFEAEAAAPPGVGGEWEFFNPLF